MNKESKNNVSEKSVDCTAVADNSNYHDASGKICDRWYNPERQTYICEDGLTVEGRWFDSQEHCWKKYQIAKVGEDGFTEELLLQTAQMHEEEDESDFNYQRIEDFRVESVKCKPEMNGGVDIISFVDSLAQPLPSAHEQLFTEEKELSREESIVRDVIQNECSDRQKRIYHRRFVCGWKLDAIAEEDALVLGNVKPTSVKIISRILVQIEEKVCKALGVVRSKKR